MSSVKNKHGLPRHIPEETKRRVRSTCGNGCVVCGRMPFEYDHFDPEYAEARTHNPERIALLCPTHHAEKTSGRLGITEIASARLNPHNANKDARWDLPLGRIGARSVKICGTTIVGGLYPGLVVNNVPVFAVRRDDGGDWLLSGAFCDEDGRQFVRIVDNELTLYRGTWDVSLEGTNFIVRSALRRIALHFTIDGTAGAVTLQAFSSRLANGFRLESDANMLRFSTPSFAQTIHIGGGNVINYEWDTIVPEILEPHGININAPAAGTWNDWVARPDPSGTFRRRQEARQRVMAKAARKRQREARKHRR